MGKKKKNKKNKNKNKNKDNQVIRTLEEQFALCRSPCIGYSKYKSNAGIEHENCYVWNVILEEFCPYPCKYYIKDKTYRSIDRIKEGIKELSEKEAVVLNLLKSSREGIILDVLNDEQKGCLGNINNIGILQKYMVRIKSYNKSYGKLSGNSILDFHFKMKLHKAVKIKDEYFDII